MRIPPHPMPVVVRPTLGDDRSRWLSPELCAWLMDRMVGVDSRQVAVSPGPLSVNGYGLICMLAFLQF